MTESSESRSTNDKSTVPSPSASSSAQMPTAFNNASSPFSRSAKQLGLFFAGAGFMLVTTMVTRRAVVRKQIAAFPRFYSPSHAPAGTQGNPEGSFIALEALNLATLNVLSFGIMATGGAAWAFDITSVAELRDRAQRTLYGQAGKQDEEAEREFEEWAAKVLTRLGKNPPEGGSESQTETKNTDKKE